MLATKAIRRATATPASTRSHHVASRSSRGRMRLLMAVRSDRNILIAYHATHAVVKVKSCDVVQKYLPDVAEHGSRHRRSGDGPQPAGCTAWRTVQRAGRSDVGRLRVIQPETGQQGRVGIGLKASLKARKPDQHRFHRLKRGLHGKEVFALGPLESSGGQAGCGPAQPGGAPWSPVLARGVSPPSAWAGYRVTEAGNGERPDR
jgi:hypothetical protein